MCIKTRFGATKMSVVWKCRICDKICNQDGRCANIMNNICPTCFWNQKYYCTRCKEVNFKDSSEIWTHKDLFGQYCIDCAEYYNEYFNISGRVNNFGEK